MRKREKIEKISTFRPSFLTPCFWPLDIIHHFLNCFHCIHMSIFFKRSTLEFASWLHLPKYPKSIQKSPMLLFHTRSIWLLSRSQMFPLSSCSMWWCGCSGHDICELDYTSRVYFLLMMLIKKERIYPFSHSIYMEKNHLVKQNSLLSFQWIILCYVYC